MNGFFSAFPSGSPGAGLLLLRAAVAIALVMRGVVVFVARDATIGAIAIDALSLIAGLSMLAGFMTPIAGALAAIAALAATTPLIDTAVISAALILLGPGAFSIDARLFGRREITIPD